MRRDIILMAISLISIVLGIGCITLTSVSAVGKGEGAPPLSYAFNDSPEHIAIIKLLEEAGEKNILQTAHSISMSKGSDFAEVLIAYSLQEESAEIGAFLFKESDAWVAYRELPTKKDHSAIFTILARRQCKPSYKHLQGISLIDDTWKSNNRQKRIVNIVCSELINNEWKDHRKTFVYEYDDKKGWHITGERAISQISEKKPQKKEFPKTPRKPRKAKTKPAVFSANAKEVMGTILQHIGIKTKPVFILFGTSGSDFIQYHYVAEGGGKVIQTVDWLNGKLLEPQPSRLARPCQPFTLEELNFDLVAKIFEETIRKAKQGDNVSVNVTRLSTKDCQEPVWQGIATSARYVLTITFSIDGKQTDIQEYSF